MKPPFAYFGGKTMLAERIAALLPPHQHYVEPYCGSLAVLLAKRPSKMETVNDLNQELMTFWRVLRERPEDLARACALTPHSRAEFLACREATSAADELETARRVWVVLTQGRSGTLRETKTGWRHFVLPRGSSVGMPGYLAGYVERMTAVVGRLRNVSLECMPAEDLIAKYGRDPQVVMYVDPPYLGSTRGWGLNYRHEMKSDDEHRGLAELLRFSKASVLLSGYASPLYDEDLYPDWHRIEIPAITGNGVGERGMARTEVIWSNRPFTAQAALFEAVS